MEPPSLSLVIPTLLFGITLTARALFSFLETSITALRLFKLKELARTLKEYKYLFTILEENPQRVLITILVANCLADVLTASLALYIMTSLFKQLHLSGGLGFSMGIALATLAILIFGEIIPKALAKTTSDRLFLSTLWITNMLLYAFYPLITILLKLSSYFTSPLGKRPPLKTNEWITSEREVRFLIDYISEKGLIEAQKNELLQNIFELGKKPIRDIMVPSSDIISIEAASSVEEILMLFLHYHFSRIPIYEDTKDNIIGMLHIKDLLPMVYRKESKELKDVMRPIMFVPESMKVNQLLQEFQNQQMHIAVVINEHGSVNGLITLEDVLEEIVGDISDEHEEKTEKIIPLKEGGWLIHASTQLEELNKLFNVALESENAHTLGGFITEKLQHLPQKGDGITYKDYKFTVKKASKKRVLQILVLPPGTRKHASAT